MLIVSKKAPQTQIHEKAAELPESFAGEVKASITRRVELASIAPWSQLCSIQEKKTATDTEQQSAFPSKSSTG